MGFKKGQSPWNKGLTRDSSPIVDKYTQSRINTWKNKRIVKKCVGCENGFEVTESTKNKRYCSWKCFNKYYKRPIKILKKRCIFCNRIFTNHEIGVFGKGFDQRQFCSRKCWNQFKLKRKREYWLKTHDQLIDEERQKLIKRGYRTIKLGKVIPDLIAMKDGKVTAVEVERGTYDARLDKYDDNKDYDDVKWIFRKPKGIGRNNRSTT